MIVTATLDGEPDRLGMTTVHEVWLGQFVLAGCPSTRASTRPFGLKKFVPRTTTTVPACPADGERVDSVGTLPGAGASVVVVVGDVEVVVLEDGGVVVVGVVFT